MSAFFQMGHDTENLIGELDLEDFKGIILSPLNRDPAELRANIQKFRQKGTYEIVFDSQLYCPNSNRGSLPSHPYFPADLDTADLSSEMWWNGIVKSIFDYCVDLGVDSVVSPVVLPKIWNDDYFAICTEISKKLTMELRDSSIKSYTTVMVNMKELSDENYGLRVASIVSDAAAFGYYVIFVSDVDPRREFSEADELFGAMSLIRELESTKRPVIISNCSSDMLLYKAAGASICATNKYFNLRRFTKSRYDEPSGGGGQLPYWFEHSLIAFLREADVLRLSNEGFLDLVGCEFSDNYWSRQILEQLRSGTNKPWLALAWRQYLSWYCKSENALSTGNASTMLNEWLRQAENNWLKLEDASILFDEPRNDGKWIRPWRQALVKFNKHYAIGSSIN